MKKPTPRPTTRSDRVALALDGPILDATRSTTPDEWEELRTTVWRKWLAGGGSWPPAAAELDGLEGRVLRRAWAHPLAIREVVTTAKEDLRALERFRKRNPEAAETIAEPLARYEQLLQEAFEDPESRLYERQS